MAIPSRPVAGVGATSRTPAQVAWDKQYGSQVAPKPVDWLAQAQQEAQGIYAPQVESANLYYNTLATKLGELQTQNLGQLKSGWAGSETLPSSGFYQQQRSDVLKQFGEQGSANERARAAELANIAAQKSSYARGAYQQGITMPLVEQQRALAEKNYGLQAQTLELNKFTNLADFYADPYSVTSFNADILAQALRNLGYNVIK